MGNNREEMKEKVGGRGRQICSGVTGLQQ